MADTLTCFNLVWHEKGPFVEYKNIRVFPEFTDFNNYLGRGESTLDEFVQEIDDTIRKLSDESLELLEESDLTLNLGTGTKTDPVKNIDILDDSGDMIYRGNAEDLDEFIKIYKAGNKVKRINLRRIIDDITVNLKDFIYDASETKRIFGHNIPPSEGKWANGLAPDFKKAPKHLFGQRTDFGEITIKMTGSRKHDEKAAIAKAIEKGLIDKPDDIPDHYTWHHLDDFNPETGECTMQLIPTIMHNEIGDHVGSVAIWKRFYEVGEYH